MLKRFAGIWWGDQGLSSLLLGIFALFFRSPFPGAFSFPASSPLDEQNRRSSLAYFSFVTMTTLGYGDVVPVSPVSRMFVIVEALIGQLYPATLLARLVSLQILHQGESVVQDSPHDP